LIRCMLFRCHGSSCVSKIDRPYYPDIGLP
jgi:hypothetical protein